MFSQFVLWQPGSWRVGSWRGLRGRGIVVTENNDSATKKGISKYFIDKVDPDAMDLGFLLAGLLGFAIGSFVWGIS